MSVSDDEEALFDDIYGSDDDSKEETTKPEIDSKKDSSKPEETKFETLVEASTENDEAKPNENSAFPPSPAPETSPSEVNNESTNSIPPPSTSATSQVTESNTQNSGRKVDLSRDAGKMFIGGLDWDTTEERMKEYFSKFGEVIDHTIMRESSTGRSRGFGFLTFASSSSVDEVVKTQHVLDGKVIDPKRAIPREEQDKTGKIFVGGIAPEVRPKEFEDFFGKFGTIIDAQLMLDKDTGRSRGFGFVTFDAPEAVDRVCQGRYLDFNGRQIEVKRAEPRGPQQQQNHIQQQQQRYLQQQGFPQANSLPAQPTQPTQQAPVTAGAPGGQMYGGMTPEAMTAYWQQMQQYWLQFQQNQQSGNAVPVLPQNLQNLAQQFQSGQLNPPTGPTGQPQPPTGPQGEGQSQDEGDFKESESYDDYGSYRRRDYAPYGAPRGPRGGNRGGRGRGRGGRGGYNRNEFHPYSRS